MVRFADELVRKELESLGVTDYVSVDPSNVHILLADVFEREFPNSRNSAIHQSTSSNIVLNGGVSKPLLFRLMVHELVHWASTRKFYFDKEDESYLDARTGYRIRSSWKEPVERQALVGFNEIMVEQTTIKILRKNQSLLQENVNITPDELDGPIYSYMEYAPLLSDIAKGITAYKNTSMAQVFTDLELGQFQKHILALKDIEGAFGKGSLKVLSCLGVPRDDNSRREIDEAVIKYFSTTDPNQRAEMQPSLLLRFNEMRKKSSFTPE